jgi:hypothetical protein
VIQTQYRCPGKSNQQTDTTTSLPLTDHQKFQLLFSYPRVRMTKAGNEGFEEDPGLVPENFWITVCHCHNNAASSLLHLMEMIEKGYRHYLGHHQPSSKNYHEHMPKSALKLDMLRCNPKQKFTSTKGTWVASTPTYWKYIMNRGDSNPVQRINDGLQCRKLALL